MANRDASASALAGFGPIWIGALLGAVVATIAANMVVGVPLGAVVDVVMALVVVVLGLAEIYFLFRALALLLRGRTHEALGWFGAMAIYLLLVFPPILAFDAYGWLTHQALAGQSNMYDSVKGAVAATFKAPAQLISAVLVLVLNAGSAYVSYVVQARTALEIGANLLSIVVALQALLHRRARHGEGEH